MNGEWYEGEWLAVLMLLQYMLNCLAGNTAVEPPQILCHLCARVWLHGHKIVLLSLGFSLVQMYRWYMKSITMCAAECKICSTFSSIWKRIK